MHDTCERHDWTEHEDTHDMVGNLISRTWFCSQCPETVAACHTCGGPCDTANLACTKCLNQAKRTLHDIQEAAQTPYAYQLGLQAVRYDRDYLTGSINETGTGNMPAPDDIDLARTVAKSTGRTILEILRDPPNVLEPIITWTEAWREHHNENAPTNPYEYLTKKHVWAANNPNQSGWHDYLTEIKTIRTRLRALVGLADRMEPIPCVHCGGKILQRNGTHGLEDIRTCTGCNLTYENEDHLTFVNFTYYRAIPETHPDTPVTTDDARRIIPDLKRNTLNQWIKRKHITPLQDDEGNPRTNVRGELLYRIGSIYERHTRKDDNGEEETLATPAP
ncbi:MAG TPA: hypothetical protein VK054_09415 [Beutenbergiaceae bacterium]|nr:hypothetical protein [Beutenbergiaceae bacterium]